MPEKEEFGNNIPKVYDPQSFEKKWYEFWEKNKFFHAEVDKSKKPYSMVIPPPNVTGQLHMGHALDNTLQDILIRYHRMQGYNTVWIPGCDHAGIATQAKGRGGSARRGYEPLRTRTREVPRARLGLEGEVRQPHHVPAAFARLLARLGP